MLDARYSRIAAEIQHGELTGHDIAHLGRRERDYALRVTAHEDARVPVEQTLAWYREAPHGNTAALVGAAKVRVARRLKGTRLFADMTADDADHVRAVLTDAKAFLKNASAHFPDAFLPWVPRIGIAHLMERGADEVERMFVEAQSREKWNVQAAELAFLGQMPRWRADPLALFTWATNTMVAPPSHPIQCLVAMAEAARLRLIPNVPLEDIPVRLRLDLPAMFSDYVRTLPDDADPEDVVALGAWLDIIQPTTTQTAQDVRHALTVLKGRVASYPFLWARDPMGEFAHMIALREKQVRHLLD